MRSSGARPMSRAYVQARQLRTRSEGALSREELWEVTRTAVRSIDLSPNAVGVLYQLVACWGENPVAGRMIVWPSNETLCMDTKLCEREVRYCLRELIEARIIVDKPSPNGKRYLDQRTGEPYGLDLTPLAARKDEFATIYAMRRAQQALQGQIKRAMTVCRRAIEEALTALSESFPGVSCDDLRAELADLRARSRGEVESAVLGLWTALQEKAELRFYHAAKPGTPCPHIESNLESHSETCMAPEGEHVAPLEQNLPNVSVVTQACPAATELAGRPVRTLDDLVAAGEFLRPQIGISPDAWREARELVGSAGAAATVFYTIQMIERLQTRGKSILKPGGYFREMVRRQASRSFSLEAALLGLIRVSGG